MTNTDKLNEGFADVTRQASDPALFFHILDMQAAAPAIIAMRRDALATLAPQPGGQFLDVGCGTGEVARSIVPLVLPGGTVTGVDASPVMIAEAQRRTEAADAIEFRIADAMALDMPDAAFDGVHCERVLQHVEDPAQALSELIRVTKPGGRVVVADTDWDTAIFAAVDLDVERRMRRDLSDGFRNGTIGRRLYGMFHEAGLADIDVRAHSLLFTDWDPDTGVGPPVDREIERAVAAGVLSGAEGEQATADLRASAKAGTFFCSVTMFLCSGTRR